MHPHGAHDDDVGRHSDDVLVGAGSAKCARSVRGRPPTARTAAAPHPAAPTPALEPFAAQTIALDWTRRASYAVVARDELARDRRRQLHWIDIHCGPCTWQILDQDGYHSAVDLLRRAHSTAVHVFTDGPRFSADPTLDDYRPTPE